MSFVPSAADIALLDEVQRRTLGYFWDFAHPVSFMARDRSTSDDDPGNDICTTGGTGMGVMAIIVGVERGWIPRDAALDRLFRLTLFLLNGDHYHGVVPHFMNGSTGRTIRFSRKDDGGDLVETAFLVQGLLAARQYFSGDGQSERALRGCIDQLWRDVEWDWHRREDQNVLFWHWSPNHGWALNHEIRGWNECLMVYLLAVSSPSHPVTPEIYHSGFAMGRDFQNKRFWYGIELPLGPDYGGPLFFTHYSFLGLDPRGLVDRYADYFAQNEAHARINYAHCVANPKGFKGYGPDCWGLTASDDEQGYDAHAPGNDRGVITPTAALSSFPYVPDLAMQALRHFDGALGDRIWRRYGFVDAFNETAGWYASTHLAIDQAPIVVMIENWRSGLLWRLFMSCPEIQAGLRRLEFRSPWLVG
jgi:hypothetical protein